MWFGAPLAAYLCQRNVLIGLSFWGLLFANGLVHTAGGVTQGGYNTGLWTAAFLSVPLSVWVIYACAIRGPFQGRDDRQCGPAGLCRRDRVRLVSFWRPLQRFLDLSYSRPVDADRSGKKHAEQGRFWTFSPAAFGQPPGSLRAIGSRVRRPVSEHVAPRRRV